MSPLPLLIVMQRRVTASFLTSFRIILLVPASTGFPMGLHEETMQIVFGFSRHVKVYAQYRDLCYASNTPVKFRNEGITEELYGSRNRITPLILVHVFNVTPHVGGLTYRLWSPFSRWLTGGNTKIKFVLPILGETRFQAPRVPTAYPNWTSEGDKLPF